MTVWRNTVTFDADVAVRLKRFLRKHDKGFKEAVNEIMRSGLDNLEAPPKKREPFRTTVVDLGEPRFKTPEQLKALIAEMDDEYDRKKLGFHDSD